MKIAVIGATGLVGGVMLRLLEERNFPVTELILVASTKSIGKTILFRKQAQKVISIEEAIEMVPDIAIFSAGGKTSLQYAKAFTSKGTVVIDNSSAWRMDPKVPLVVPEVNGAAIQNNLLIANPNCSTMQMMLPLKPIHDAFIIKRLVISTYQSFTGTGSIAVKQYENEKLGKKILDGENAYPHPIFENCLPHCGDFKEDGYTTEEIKLVKETRKILDDEKINITATCVRVPVFGGHSESINIELEKDFSIDDVKKMMENAHGIVLQDDIRQFIYPMPLSSYEKDDVFVGRIRRDPSIKNGLNMWVVSDNLRKGAATNTIQIAEYMLDHGLIPNLADTMIK